VRVYKSPIWIALALTVLASGGVARGDNFGTGGNQFSLDFASISGATNPASGYGIVNNNYRIGISDISNDQWAKFKANLGYAVTGSPWYAYDQSLFFTAANVPVNCVSWYQAAQFVNWLNTSTGHAAAYNFTGTQGTSNYTFTTWSPAQAANGTNLYRNKDAVYYLPTEDEWVKAAYWNGTTLQTFATSGNTAPTQGNGSGTGWNFYSNGYATSPYGPWPASSGSPELHGTYNMTGNVWQWLESPNSDPNYGAGSARALRGGSFSFGVSAMASSASSRNVNPPLNGDPGSGGDVDIGFRVASAVNVLPPTALVWSGSVNSVWDVNGTANFSGSLSGKYNDGDFVTFDNTSNNPTVAIAAGGVAPGSVVFANTIAKSYTLSGGPIAGATGLVVSGGGLVTLNNSSTYTGTTSIGSGTLSAGILVVSGGSSSLGNASSAVVLGDATNQGTLSYSGGAANYTRGLTINAGGGQLTNLGTGLLTVSGGSIAAGGLLTVSGTQDIGISSVISGSSLTKIGGNLLTLSGTSSLSGVVAVNGGSMTISSGGSLSSGNNSASNIGSGAADNNVAVTISGANSVWKNSGEIRVGLSGSNNTVTVSGGGKLWAGGGNDHISIGYNSGSNNNTLLVTGAGSSLVAEDYLMVGRVGTGNTLRVENGAAASCYLLWSSGGTGNPTGSSNSTVTVSGAGSQLSVTSTWDLADRGTGNQFNVLNGGVVNMAGGAGYVGYYTGNCTVLVDGSGSVWNTAAVDWANGGSSAPMTLSNGGRWNANGQITFRNNNTFNLNSGGELNVQTLNLAAAGGRLNFNGGRLIAQSTGSLVNGAGQIDLQGAGYIKTDYAKSIANLIFDTGSLIKEGVGALTLTGANTYSGATTISAGILKAGIASVAGASGAFGKNSAVSLANAAGAALDISGYNTQIGSLAGGGAIGGNVTLGAATLSVGGDNTSTGYAGVISSSGSPVASLIKIGNGSLTLTGSNTYLGSTTINAGMLVAGASNSLSGNSALTISGGTLDASGFANVVKSLTITSGGLKLGLGTTLTSSGAAALAGNLNVFGTGTLGNYPLLTYSSSSGSFTSATGLDSNYGLLYKTTELDALHKSQVGSNLTVTASYPTVITGGATALTVNVTNSAPSLSDALNLTATASGPGYGPSATGSLAATTSGNFTIANGFNSSSLSAGVYTGTVTVSGTNSALGGLALNSGGTQSVTVNVLGHGNGSVSGETIGLPLAHVGYAGSLTGTSSASVSNASGYLVNLMTVGATTSGNLSINNVRGVIPGGSAAIGATLANGQPIGAINQNFTLTYADDSDLPGANNSLGSLVITVTGSVYSGKALWSTTGGAWASSDNWKDTVGGGPAGAPGLDAGFTGVDTATFGNTSGSVTVNLDGAAPNLNDVTFNNTGSYTLALGSGTTGITLAGASPRITATGTQGIRVPVALGSNITISVTNSDDRLTVSDVISGPGMSLTKIGSGTLLLSGTGLYTGGTIVNAGILAITSSTALPDGGRLIVGAGGTLIFDPSYSFSPIVGTPVSPLAASPVPEPGTLVLLMAAGFVAAAGARRRKRDCKLKIEN